MAFVTCLCVFPLWVIKWLWLPFILPHGDQRKGYLIKVFVLISELESWAGTFMLPLGTNPAGRSSGVIQRLTEYQNLSVSTERYLIHYLTHPHFDKEQMNIVLTTPINDRLSVTCIGLFLPIAHLAHLTTCWVFFICISHFSSCKINAPRARAVSYPAPSNVVFLIGSTLISQRICVTQLTWLDLISAQVRSQFTEWLWWLNTIT